MKLLVLGGTQFVGRHIVQDALDRGHDVTLFTRGQTNADLFPEAEHLTGDRSSDLSALEGRTWDAVIDVSGYLPRDVERSCDALAGSVGHYVYISTISVYDWEAATRVDEDAPVARLEGAENATEVTDESYGPLKALCEEVVTDRFGSACTIIRPGLVVGPHDHTERFTYWPRRIAEGGRVLAPGDPDRLVQFIDGRDLGEWTVSVTEHSLAGTYNAVGPAEDLTMEELLETCKTVSSSDADLVWIDDRSLLDAGVEPWSGLPLWSPEDDARVDMRRAAGAGLEFRPLEVTVRDTLEWDRHRPPAEKKDALSRAREAEILERYRPTQV